MAVLRLAATDANPTTRSTICGVLASRKPEAVVPQTNESAAHSIVFEICERGARRGVSRAPTRAACVQMRRASGVVVSTACALLRPPKAIECGTSTALRHC